MAILLWVWWKVHTFPSRMIKKRKITYIPKELSNLEFSYKRGGFFRKGIDDKGIILKKDDVDKLFKRSNTRQT